MARLLRTLGCLTTAVLLGTGCAPKSEHTPGGDPNASAPAIELTPISVQLDWFPEPAHGGFYQAAAKGYYTQVGLEVELNPGGPGGRPTQKVAAGQVDISMGRSDDMMLAAQEGLPVLIVAALMQHDPQALLVHANSPVKNFDDLEGKEIMAYPGAAWIPYLKSRFDIEFDIMPLSYGLARFISDPDLIQACFITDEPYRLVKEGVPVRTLLLSDAGYDPYRVIVANRSFAAKNQATMRAFIAATLRGWEDYLLGDPAPAHELIDAANEHMDADQMAYSHEQMRARRFVQGFPNRGEQIGKLDPARLRAHSELLHRLGVLEKDMLIREYAVLRYLPEDLRPSTRAESARQ